MKKILALALAFIMALSLAACGGGNDTPAPSGSNDNTPSSSEQQEQPSNNDDGGEDEAPDNTSDDRFTEFGLSFDTVQPEGSTAFEVEDDTDRTYSVTFTMPETVTEEVGFSYYKKIYDLTAAISEGGTNYKESGGTAISPEVSPMGEWEDEHSAAAHMNTWFYKYNGKLYNVLIMGDIGFGDEISVSIYDYT